MTNAYNETLDYIKNLTKFGINLGLGRIEALLERLGNPERSLKIVHIGGTNGKGSTTAILRSILQHAGYRVGMFISPHLDDYRERITINGRMISEHDIIDNIRIIKPHLDEMVAGGIEHPTEFEISTALAFLYFAQQKPDIVLLEVGLGGEIDSTNVVTPWVSVITNIGLDHMDYLGDTPEKIARVKAGIIKEGIPVVTAAVQPDALAVIAAKAQSLKAPLVVVGSDVCWEEAGGFNYRGLRWHYDHLSLSLLGRHQYTNASTALAVCELLELNHEFKISQTAVRAGLGAVVWPGRLELISHNPKILLDGAHNAEGMESLAQALADYAGSSFKRKRLIVCIGMLQDKDIEKALAYIMPLADIIVITKPDSPRAVDWQRLAVPAAQYLSPENIHLIESPFAAVQYCLDRMEEHDMTCVTGSLYMIGPVRRFLIDQCGLKA